MRILRNCFGHVIGDPHIEQHRKEEGKIQDGRKIPVIVCPDDVLHSDVDKENGSRFYQQIQEQRNPKTFKK
jgi:hypothetical protein